MSRRYGHREGGGMPDPETPRDTMDRIKTIWGWVVREYEKEPSFSLELEEEVNRNSGGFLQQILRTENGSGTDENCKIIAGIFSKAAEEVGHFANKDKKQKLTDLATFFSRNSHDPEVKKAGDLQAKLNKMQNS
jgi:hypothetical protein